LDCSVQQCTNGAWCPRQTAAAEQRSKWPIISFLSPVPPSKWALGLAALDDDTVYWLKTTALSI